jgi:hypothetical protein
MLFVKPLCCYLLWLAVLGSTCACFKVLAGLVAAPCLVGRRALLSQLDITPHLFPEDPEKPQLLLLVPSFELGVQVCVRCCVAAASCVLSLAAGKQPLSGWVCFFPFVGK